MVAGEGEGRDDDTAGPVSNWKVKSEPTEHQHTFLLSLKWSSLQITGHMEKVCHLERKQMIM